MKKMILALLIILGSLSASAKNWIVVNSGYTFSPASLTIDEGDDVTFTLESTHDAAEVSQAVWNSNGNSPIIGFSVPYGGGFVASTELPVGTHFYVCVPHASMGMKGKIIVQPVSGLEKVKSGDSIQVYPNPAKSWLGVQCQFPVSVSLEIKLFNLEGKLVQLLLARTPVGPSFQKEFDLGLKVVPGVYVLQIAAGEKVSHRKVVVI
jgi:plastocyanin